MGVANKQTIEELRYLQALPLDLKISITKQRLREWVNYWGLDGVYVSFSGGKDSTVLLDIAREMYPSIKAVFIDTGLEYPEIREFVKTYDNVDWLKPKMHFKQVIEKYGYPFISKEVSGCVAESRNWFDKNAERMNADTDRQTDRPKECLCNSGYAWDSEAKKFRSGREILRTPEGSYP